METSLWKTGFGRIASRSAQALLIITLITVVIYALVKLSVVVVPIILATILASAISPMVSLMEKLKINRAAGSLTTLIALISILISAGFFIFSSVMTQWSSLSQSVIKGFNQILDWLHSGDLPVPVEQIDELLNSAGEYLTSSSFGKGALELSGSMATIGASFVLTLVILFFFLKDGSKIYKFIVSFLPQEIRANAQEAGERSANTLGRYIRGTTMVALVDVVLIGIGLAILGVPLILPLCILVFIGAFIPYIGATSAGIIASLVALVANGLESAIIVGIIVLAVNQLEGHILAPFILGNALRISPLAILLALSLGAILGGIVGTLLAVPIAAVTWVTWTTWHKEEIPDDNPEHETINEESKVEPENDSQKVLENDDKA